VNGKLPTKAVPLGRVRPLDTLAGWQAGGKVLHYDISSAAMNSADNVPV
jgi:hypothetical protein